MSKINFVLILLVVYIVNLNILSSVNCEGFVKDWTELAKRNDLVIGVPKDEKTTGFYLQWGKTPINSICGFDTNNYGQVDELVIKPELYKIDSVSVILNDTDHDGIFDKITYTTKDGFIIIDSNIDGQAETKIDTHNKVFYAFVEDKWYKRKNHKNGFYIFINNKWEKIEQINGYWKIEDKIKK